MTFTRITALAVSSAALLAVAACGQNETKKEPAPVETAPPAMA
ncbi:fasciclin domain-containing protein, partial [Brevundimonas diminuta]